MKTWPYPTDARNFVAQKSTDIELKTKNQKTLKN